MPQLSTRKGDHNIVSKKNATGSDIAAARVVKLAATKDCIALPAADTDHVYGVTMKTIRNGEFGDVQCGPSKAICTAAGALATVGALLKADTAGKVTAWSASAGNNAHFVGCVNTTAAGLDSQLEVELAAPLSIKQG